MDSRGAFTSEEPRLPCDDDRGAVGYRGGQAADAPGRARPGVDPDDVPYRVPSCVSASDYVDRAAQGEGGRVGQRVREPARRAHGPH